MPLALFWCNLIDELSDSVGPPDGREARPAMLEEGWPTEKAAGSPPSTGPSPKRGSLVGAIFAGVGGGLGDGVAIITGGKTRGQKEKEAAVKIQAAVRGKIAREVVDEMKPKVVESNFLCFTSRKVVVGGDENSMDGWNCFCGDRGKKRGLPSPRIPVKGLPGIARSPSFSKQQMEEKEATEVEAAKAQ